MTHRHQIRSLTALLGSVAIAAMASALPAAAHGAATATPVGVQSAHLVTLVTGQRVLETVNANGATIVSATPSVASPLLSFEVNSAWYAVPAVVVHSIGAQLDPALFDLSALGKAEAATPGQVPVQVQWQGVSAPAMPWLLHPTTITAGVTDGVVTSASGPALQDSVAAGTLTTISRISLVGAVVAPSRPSAGFRLHTLTVNGIDFKGAPDTGDVAFLLNADDALRNAGVSFEQWYHGVFKVSVPDGHYALLGDFVHFSTTGVVAGGGPPAGGQEHMAIVNFTVHGNTSVTVDARSATARIAVVTPLPTDVGSASATWQRDSRVNGGTAFGTVWSIGGGAPAFSVSVSPGPAPAVGTQGWVTSFHLDSPSTSSTPYSYDLTYGGEGAISSVQRHHVRTSQLASVATRYFSDVAGNPEMEIRPSFFPWQFFSTGILDNFSAPLDRTEYVLAAPDLLWMQNVIADANTFAGQAQDSPQVFAPGERSTADWNRGPIGPGVPVDTGAVASFPLIQGCPACVEAGLLELSVFPFGDNPPGHFGFPNFPTPGLTETDAYTILQDGTTIATGQDPIGVAVPIASGPAHYQLHYSVAITAPWRTLSTDETTTWSFSTPASTSTQPPAGWVCFSGASVGCGVVALMLPNYQLPEDETGHVASGPVTFQLGISHILGVSIAATAAQVSVSFDGGTTWVPAHVSASGANRFAISYTDPTTAGTAAIRIHVTDAKGGVLDQTILNAYAFP